MACGRHTAFHGTLRAAVVTARRTRTSNSWSQELVSGARESHRARMRNGTVSTISRATASIAAASQTSNRSGPRMARNVLSLRSRSMHDAIVDQLVREVRDCGFASLRIDIELRA